MVLDMENKENVYVETEGAENGMEQGVGTEIMCPEEVSTVPSKFKDVNALANAYASLQAEFTRRSQRLKELEKLTENLGGQAALRGGSGAEKLRKNAQARKAERQAFNAFVADMGRGNPDVQADVVGAATHKPDGETTPSLDTEREGAKGGDGEFTQGRENLEVATVAATENVGQGDGKKKNETENALGFFRTEDASVAERMEKELSADELYEKVSRNEDVRLKIIGEYLASVGKTAAPLTVGGVGAFSTPPRKVGSIGDAGNMALLYFKNSGKID